MLRRLLFPLLSALALALTAFAAPLAAHAEDDNAVGACLAADQVWLLVVTDADEVLANECVGTATTGKAFNAANVRAKLAAAQQRLGGVYVENEPWQGCLKRYDRPHTFFYADPPYWQTAGYPQEFGWEEYERLAEAMGSMQGKMMLSINDHPDITALFNSYRITRLELAYSISRAKTTGTSGELLVCNY